MYVQSNQPEIQTVRHGQREREREGGRENGREEERSVIVYVLVGLRCREGGSVRENQIGDRLIQNFLYLDLGCL